MPPSNEDWRRYQTRIKILYLDENRTLNQVMGTMARDHRFKATVKMYKNRITKWGFDQKYRKRNGHTSWPNKHQPQEQSSDGLSPIPSRDSSSGSADGHPSSRGSSSERQEGDSTMALLRTFRLSGGLERVILCYFYTSFQSRLWVSDRQGTYYRSVKAPPNIVDMISRFKHDLVAASNYIRHQGTRYGFAYLHHGSEKIADLVSAESPRLIADLIEISLWLIKQDRYDVVRIFLQQFADMSAVLNSQSLVIYRMLAQQSKLDESAFEEVALNAWSCIAACFRHELGPLHVNTLCCYTNWLMYFASTSVCARHVCSMKCDHAEYAENVLWCHLQECHDVHGPVSTQSMMLREALVHVLLVRHDYSAAEVLCSQIVDCKQTEQSHKLLFMALLSLSEAKRAQHEFRQADKSLKKLVDISAWGRNSSKAIYHMILLEDCLTKIDEAEAAANPKTNHSEVAIRTDSLPPSLTQSLSWLDGWTRSFSPATERNIATLRSSTKSSPRASHKENSVAGALEGTCRKCKGFSKTCH